MNMKNNSKKIKEISILDFPKNIFIELSEDYRNMLFQLIFLEAKTATKIIKSLKDKGFKENIFRWRRGQDRGLPQYTNLPSLLYLFEKAKKVRNNIEKETDIIKSLLENSNQRIKKSKEIIEIIKKVRFILRGNDHMAKRFNINAGTLRHYVLNEKIKTLPLDFIRHLIRFVENKILCLTFTIDELQNKIVSYQAHHGKLIKSEFNAKRKLPIEVTPEFESLIYHLFGDGHVKAIGSGEYTQLNEKGRRQFLNKLYNVFGYFDVTKKSFDDGKVIIPKAIINILCRYYNLGYGSFHWDKAKLPYNVSHEKEFKIAGLAAFIVDEGHISDRGIELYSGNRTLLSQIRNLAVDLELSCSDLKSKKGYGNTKESFRFRIRKESSRKLIQMISKLKQKYPYCGLAQKEGIIEKSDALRLANKSKLNKEDIANFSKKIKSLATRGFLS